MTKCIGFASGVGAKDDNCGLGPIYFKEHSKIHLEWEKILEIKGNLKFQNKYDLLANYLEKYAKKTYALSKKYPFFISFNGDHSSAIGTWSGIALEKKEKNLELGLLWIDAHMDAHTPETSLSGNIHGMPLATLLGYGDKRLTTILSNEPKLKAENVILIGVRSFESKEEELLKSLNVKIYRMDEILKRGFITVINEALSFLMKKTDCYGVSFDIDVVDPIFVQATGTKVPNGISANEAIDAMSIFAKTKPVAFEIVEYNPILDKNHQTFKFIEKLLANFLNI